MIVQIEPYLGYLSYFVPTFICLSGIYSAKHRKTQRGNNLMEAYKGFFFMQMSLFTKSRKKELY
jgi:hypothetical protein